MKVRKPSWQRLALLAALGTAAGCALGPDGAHSTGSDEALASSTWLWPTSPTPAHPSDPDGQPVEIGVRVRIAVDGTFGAMRFYKSAQNTGTHVGHVWSAGGTLLGSVTFAGETASGWQTARFATPIRVRAGRSYIVSYHTDAGHYAGDNNYFTTRAVTSGALTAPRDGDGGGNGVYRYGPAGFPTGSYAGSNYWVDVGFVAAASVGDAGTVIDSGTGSTTRDAGAATDSGAVTDSGTGSTTRDAGAVTDSGTGSTTILDGRELNASNTGVPAGRALREQSTTLTITEDWITRVNGGRRYIEDLNFVSGTGVNVQVSNFTIRYCRFNGRGGAGYNNAISTAGGVTNVEIQWCEFDGQHLNLRDNSTITNGGFRLRRSHLHRWPRNVWTSEGDVVIEECYMHDLTIDGSGSHVENVYVAGGNGQRYVRNRMDSNAVGTGGGISASLAIYNEDWGTFERNENILIEGNYFNSHGGASIYAGAVRSKSAPFARYTVVRGNVFGRDLNRRSGYYEPAFAFDASQPGNLWTANTWGARGPFWQSGDPEPGTAVGDPGLF